MSVPIYRRTLEGCISRAPASASRRWSGVLVTHARPRWRATAAGVGDRRGRGSDVEPCWILRSAMRGPTSCRDGESCPRGGRCLQSGTPTMHRHTAWGQWAVLVLQCIATPPGGGGQWNSYYARAHQLGRQGVLPRRQLLPKQRHSCNALPNCLVAVGSATPAMHRLCLGAVGGAAAAMHRHTAWGQWDVQILQCAAPPAGGTGTRAQEAVAA